MSVFSIGEKHLQLKKKVTSALPLGELVLEMSKDPLTQTGRKSSFALERGRAGSWQQALIFHC